MIRSVNELFVKLNLTEEKIVSQSKANNPPKWILRHNDTTDDESGLVATLSIDDGFLEAVVTEFTNNTNRDVVFFVYDLTDRVPVLAEGVMNDEPSEDQHAMFAEFYRQVNMMKFQATS